MHERKVGDVKEVVDHARGRHLPDLDLSVDPAKVRVILLPHLRDWGCGFPRTYPNQAVLLRRIDSRQVGSGGHRSTGGRRGNFLADTLGTEEPPVVRTT